MSEQPSAAGVLAAGSIVLVDFGDRAGREQAGRRPGLVVSSAVHVEIADRLVTVLPCTSSDRGWPNHIRLTGPTGLTAPTFAMTEQVTTIDRSRILRVLGVADERSFAEARAWMRRWLV